MSYFMTVSKPLDGSWVPKEAEILPARHAQSYIASLATDLSLLDGGSIYLVHDRETGTSDVLVSDLVSALQEELDVSGVPIVRVLEACFAHAVNFRIWLATNDPDAHKTNTSQASDMASVFTALKDFRGAWWHAKSDA
jgi:hypothetical protein